MDDPGGDPTTDAGASTTLTGPRPTTGGCDASASPGPVDLLVDRFVTMGLAPAAALGVLVRAARRHGVAVDVLAASIVAGR